MSQLFRPKIFVRLNLPLTIHLHFCYRYPGFHEKEYPNRYSIVHWNLMTIRLCFAFLFQWVVSGAGRILAWIIPDKPRSLDLKIKRQEYLSKESLRKYKIRTGKRRPDPNKGSDHEKIKKPAVTKTKIGGTNKSNEIETRRVKNKTKKSHSTNFDQAQVAAIYDEFDNIKNINGKNQSRKHHVSLSKRKKQTRYYETIENTRFSPVNCLSQITV